MSQISLPAARGGSLLQRAAKIDVTLAFVILTAVVLVPVFLVAVPPLADYINHLARMHVIAIGGKDADLAAFYRIDWQLIPNLAMDLVVPLFARFFDIYFAGQLFTATTVLLLVTGPLAISKVLFGRVNPLPLVAFVFVYNGIFLVGLMNYLVGVGIAMWGLAIWVKILDRPLILRLAVSTALVAALYLCHLYSLGFYGMAIGAYEIWSWAKRGYKFDRKLVLDIVAMVVPVIPAAVVLLTSSTWGLSGEYAWNSHTKVDGIAYIFRAYSDSLDLGLTALLALAFGWAMRRKLISFHGAALPLLVVGTAVFLAMPELLFGSYMADQRLPAALFLMLLGFVRLDVSDRTVRACFFGMVIAFTAVRTADVAYHWGKLGHIYDEFRQSVASLPRGAKILVTYADDPQGSDLERDAISHAPCVAMIERSALVSTAFTVKGKQIMTVRKTFQDRVDTEDGTPPTVSQAVVAAYPPTDEPVTKTYWSNWTQDHDYMFVLYTERGVKNPDPDDLSLVYEGDGFQLYKINR
ncbi:hypothetical protein [Methyloraptor flagellatus]|uniref:Glycosyltransferase RgtA/B/C/D-like domain-containing protein n=1 Tax=Methyloraptor flagellatus TaxID=3162530 RepID=A0AAU7XB59_9HYPH